MEKVKEELKYNKKGITLISLVVTIVVLLILSGISISILTGNNGLLNQASSSKKETEISGIKEKIALTLQSLEIQHLGNSKEIAAEELQKELGNNYSVVSSNKFDVLYKKNNWLFKVFEDQSIVYSGVATIKTITKTGNANTPVILSEKGVSNVSLDYKDDQEIKILGTNRFDLENAKFYMASYNSKCQIIKQNNGIKIVTESFDTVQNSLFAYTEFNAEYTGKMWISCNASTDGDVKNVGMTVKVNDTSQQLCRGEGKLAESIDVNAGDTIKILLYSHIGSDTANTVEYKNIMVQYENLTDFVEYKEDITSQANLYNTITLTGNENYTTSTTIAGGSDYRFTYVYDFPEISDGVLVTNNDNIANVELSGINLVSYNATYNNTIGLGIASNGTISIYLGEGYTKATLVEYLKSNPITIKYQTLNKENVNIDNKIKDISTGNIITSNSDFSVTYDYFTSEKNISMVCFGDSITGMFTNETDYPSMITRGSNIQAYNVGFAGCRWTDHSNSNYMPFSMNRLVDAICSGDFSMQESTASTCGVTYVERLNTLKSIDFTKIDYVTIFYGTNDWGSNVILRSIDDTSTSEKQRTNVEDAIKYSVSKLQEKYPNLKIIVITPYWRYLNNNDSDTTPNNNGDYLYDYSNYIENIAKNELNLQTINLYEQLDINISNYLKYLPDGTHPNESLKHTIANIIENKINNY